MHLTSTTEPLTFMGFAEGKATLRTKDGNEVKVPQAAIPDGVSIGDALHLAKAGHEHDAKEIMNDLLSDT